MTTSVQNNTSALLALQSLNRNTDQLNKTQDEISTQLAVATPQDNPAVWATAQLQTNQVDALGAVTTSLNRATSISDTALAAGQTVLGLLNQLKTQSLSAQDSTLQSSDRAALSTDFSGLLQQIASTISSAEFNGTNLLDGSQAASLTFLTSTDASHTVSLPTSNLSLGGSVITVSSTASLSSASTASAISAQIDASITNVTNALATLGDQANLVSAHSTLISNLSTVLQTGVGQLVDSDTAADSARLKALQVAQQLSQQSLSIANTTPQILLSLFR
jgi:flagellin